MGYTLYISGELNSDKEISKENAAAIESIKTGWGDQAFIVSKYNNTISFAAEEIHGLSPFDDIEPPLKELLDLTKSMGINISGTFEISSNSYDYDNICIDIDNNNISYGNTELRNATTEELIKELEHRGITVELKETEAETEEER